MSQTNSDSKDNKVAAPPQADEPAESPEKSSNAADDKGQKPIPVSALFRKRTAFRKRLSNYKRFKTRISDRLDGKEEAADAKDEDEKSDQEEKPARKKWPLNKCVECYKLVRNLSYAINWLALTRSDKKNFIPAVIENDLIGILSQEHFDKFKEAIAKPLNRIDETLDFQLEDSVINNLRKFIDDNEEKLVIDKMTAELDIVDKEIDARKDEPKPPRKRNKPAQKKEK